jgi:hypothetical protein
MEELALEEAAELAAERILAAEEAQRLRAEAEASGASFPVAPHAPPTQPDLEPGSKLEPEAATEAAGPASKDKPTLH